MPVYFAYRSFDLGPTGKFLKRFEDDTVLDWFRRHWDDLTLADRERADARLAEVLGCDGWFLWNPFRTAAKEEIPKPGSSRELLNLIQRCVGEENFLGSAYCLQVLTEEDGEGGALYYFDDHFLKQSGERAAYLLNGDWRLPSGHGEGPFVPAVETLELKPAGSGAGATYIALLERESKYPLDDLGGAYRIDGIRLAELPRYLCCFSNADGTRWPGSLCRLPALLIAGVELANPEEATFLRAIQAAPDDAVTWAAWSDWCQDRDREPPGITLIRRALERLARFPGRLQDELPSDSDVNSACAQLLAMEAQHQSEFRANQHSLIHVECHLAQACLDVSWASSPYFGQWLIFDDLWASAHPDLARAILIFAARWDVLSDD